jgi:metal-dependent amidase/aminoacylase/carboxypeptidase family protein
VAGSSPNIITDKCYISGSIRTKDSEIRDKINKAIQGICDGLIL